VCCWLQTEQGKQQALEAGRQIREQLLAGGKPFRVFCFHSPYRRTIQTSDKLRKAFDVDDELLGVQEDVQLREQVMAARAQMPSSIRGGALST
jgi:broad specificity phosphatase PhoE